MEAQDARPPRALVRVGLDSDGVAVVALDDPSTRNSLSDAMLDELIDALSALQHDDAARVVVITSSHPGIFSSGGNLKAFADTRPVMEKYAGLSRFPRLFALLGNLGKPVICAANGDVIAGAFGIALACDLIIAKRSVRFGCPEIKVGVFPFMVSALLRRTVGRLKANEFMLLGNLVAAEECQRLGIVNALVDDADFDATVRDWACRLADSSPLLMKLGKDAVAVTADLPLEIAYAVLQAQLALAFTTDDLAEGVAAFMDKRRPVWQSK